MIQRIQFGQRTNALINNYKPDALKNIKNTILSGNRNKLQSPRVSEESISIIRNLRKALFEKDPELINNNTKIKEYEILGSYKSFYGSGTVFKKDVSDGTEVLLSVNKDKSLFSVEITNKRKKFPQKFDIAYETTKEHNDLRIGEILDYNDLRSRIYANNHLSKHQAFNKFVNKKIDIINQIDKLVKKYL